MAGWVLSGYDYQSGGGFSGTKMSTEPCWYFLLIAGLLILFW